MAQILQHRRDTTAGLQNESGSIGEIIIDTTKNTVVVMDGVTDGGFPLAKESDIPVKVSDLQNDAGYITAASVFSGSYNDLTNTPTLFSGSYNDLTNTPALFSGAYTDLSGKPDLSIYQLANTAFNGTYSALTGKPTLFSGAYADLSGKPDLTLMNTAIQSNTTPVFSGITISPNSEFDVVNLGSVDILNAGTINAYTLQSNFFIGNNNVEFTSSLVSGQPGFNVTLKGGQSSNDAGGAVYIEGGLGSTATGDINIGTQNAGLITIARPGSTTEFYGNLNLSSAIVDGLSGLINATPPSTSLGQSGDVEGMMAVDNSYLYRCTANYTVPTWGNTVEVDIAGGNGVDSGIAVTVAVVPLVGWAISNGITTSTINQVVSQGSWHVLFWDDPIQFNVGDTVYYGASAPSQATIWKRLPWGTDTW